MFVGRAYYKRRRAIENDPHRLRWFEVPEDPDPEDDAEDYDRFGMMMKIDQMDRSWRDLINEYGFTHVINQMSHGQDAATELCARGFGWRKIVRS